MGVLNFPITLQLNPYKAWHLPTDPGERGGDVRSRPAWAPAPGCQSRLRSRKKESGRGVTAEESVEYWDG